MISVEQASWKIVRMAKTFIVAIFLDTVNVINVKLFMMILLIELDLFIALSVTFVVFQGHSNFKKF